jgi:hypothetical protein
MLQEIVSKICSVCGSENIVKNGRDYKKDQKFHCNDCVAYETIDATGRYTEERKEEILRSYHDRCSMRGISRIFGVARETLARWLRQKDKILPDVADTLDAVCPAMCWNSMDCGPLCTPKTTSAEYGLLCVVGLDRLWHSTSVTVVKQAVGSSGRGYLL